MPNNFLTPFAVAPPPKSVKKGHKKKVLETNAYLETTRAILADSIGAGAWATVPNDEKTKREFGSKDPGRAFYLAVQAFLKQHHLESRFEIRKSQPDAYPEGFSLFTIKPVLDDLVRAVPHEVQPRSSSTAPRGKKRTEPNQ